MTGGSSPPGLAEGIVDDGMRESIRNYLVITQVQQVYTPEICQSFLMNFRQGVRAEVDGR